MTIGRVYCWDLNPALELGGTVHTELVDLPRLDHPRALCGRHVAVRNAGFLPGPTHDAPATAIGDAAPDASDSYAFDPAGGGPRLDRGPITDAAILDRGVHASRFGEVNTYFHLDRIAAYVDRLLKDLGAPGLPRVTAVVNAHPAVLSPDRPPDGVKRRDRWRPFQGGHYRLPGPRGKVLEREPVDGSGEIHLGPGHELLDAGALVQASGVRYRHNASHNAGILYHEYGHHIARHTADFLDNRSRPADMQDNRKTSLEEGVCDYWAATMLASPHIWAWHRRHEGEVVHRRSLTSAKTIADFEHGPDGDPHANATIWAAALWDVRCAMEAPERTDLLVVHMLVAWHSLARSPAVRDGADSYRLGLRLLLRADAECFEGRHAGILRNTFARRGIDAVAESELSFERRRHERRHGS